MRRPETRVVDKAVRKLYNKRNKMKKQKLSWQAYEKIKKLIESRHFSPGDSMPENELSAILEMSRTPIREALQRLEDEQMVVIKPHLGAFVATLDLGQLLNIYETREAIDGMIARLLCKPHVETRVFSDLRKKHLKIKSIPDTTERITRWNEYAKEYRPALWSNCNNPMLVNLAASVHARAGLMCFIHQIIHQYPDAAMPDRIEVLDAIIAKDALKAEEAARQHVRDIFSRIMKFMTQQ